MYVCMWVYTQVGISVFVFIYMCADFLGGDCEGVLHNRSITENLFMHV